MKHFFKYSILIINIVVIIAALGCYLAPRIEPDKLSIFPTLSVATPYVILALLGFTLYWLLTKSKFFLLPLITLLLGYSTVKRNFNLSLADSVQAQHSQSINIGSININSGRYLLSSKDEYNQPRLESFKEWISKFDDKDIITVQEKRFTGERLLDEYLGEKFEKHGAPDIGTGIYSKYPITDSGFIKVGGNTNYAAWADLKISETGTLRVYSVHLSSNMITKASEAIVRDTTKDNQQRMSDIKRIFASYARYSKERNQQLDILKEHIEISPHPVVLAGDFNDVPQSRVYHELSTRFDDTFHNGNFGIGSTYRGVLPWLRIDYIFLDEGLSSLDFEVNKYDISDHYPISATFTLEKP